MIPVRICSSRHAGLAARRTLQCPSSVAAAVSVSATEAASTTRSFRTLVEPFRIHTVQRIAFPERDEREEALQRAGYNLFNLQSEDVIVDLLTDSGTGAMSARQWAGMLDGDETYAGSRSYQRLRDTIGDITGLAHVIPTHQGRAAEKILFSNLVGDDATQQKTIFSNTFFDTTRANAEFAGLVATDIVVPEGHDSQALAPFKGNMDVNALEEGIRAAGAENVPLVLLTVTNNSGGGQPVSMSNIKAVREVCDRHGVPLFFDACRFAENAWFIKTREPGYASKTPKEIAQEMFSHVDGCTMSAKKDGLANIGGFLAMNNEELAERCRNLLILTEGFTTYGGMAGYDMEAIAQGLVEVLEPAYLEYRVRSTAYLAEKISGLALSSALSPATHEAGLGDTGGGTDEKLHFVEVSGLAEDLGGASVPIMQPPGGHAVYIDAASLLPHIPPSEFPAQSLAVELYRRGGVRGVEIGSVMFGKPAPDLKGPDVAPAPMELVRLAIPRRSYTQSHMDYVAEVVRDVAGDAASLKGYRIVSQPPWLRHFTATFEPIV